MNRIYVASALPESYIGRKSRESSIMSVTAARQLSATGNETGIPPSGRNPISDVSRKPPPLGQNLSSHPASTSGFVQPSWFGAGGADGRGGKRSTEGRSGELGPRGSSRGVVQDILNMPATPSMSTDYATGWQTNAIIPYAKIVRKYKQPLLVAAQLYQLIITKVEKKDPTNVRKEEERRYSPLNVPAWNFLQALSEDMPTSSEEVTTAEQVWKNWGTEGTVRSEEGAEYTDSIDERDKERVLNFVIRGYAFVYNTWGNNIRSGTRLYLILKKKKIQSVKQWDLNPNGTGDVQNVSAMSRTSLTDKPFQLSFWAHHQYDHPPDKILEYEDEFGFRHRGKAIYIGFAEKGSAFNPNQRTVSNVNTSLSSILAQPQFWIFLDPE